MKYKSVRQCKCMRYMWDEIIIQTDNEAVKTIQILEHNSVK